MTVPSSCAVRLKVTISALAVTGLRALVRLIPPTRNVLCMVVMVLKSAMFRGPLTTSRLSGAARSISSSARAAPEAAVGSAATSAWTGAVGASGGGVSMGEPPAMSSGYGENAPDSASSVGYPTEYEPESWS